MDLFRAALGSYLPCPMVAQVLGDSMATATNAQTDCDFVPTSCESTL
jgi:hypothetical protein